MVGNSKDCYDLHLMKRDLNGPPSCHTDRVVQFLFVALQRYRGLLPAMTRAARQPFTATQCSVLVVHSITHPGHTTTTRPLLPSPDAMSRRVLSWYAISCPVLSCRVIT